MIFLQKFYSPNILAVASSLVGEDSLSHHVDPAIGVYIIDRYRHSCYWLFGCYWCLHHEQVYLLLVANGCYWLPNHLNTLLHCAQKIPIESNYSGTLIMPWSSSRGLRQTPKRQWENSSKCAPKGFAYPLWVQEPTSSGSNPAFPISS